MITAVRNERGIALMIALMIMLMLIIIGIGIVKSSNDEVTIAGNELNEMRAFYAAESGLEKATAWIQSYYEKHAVPPPSFPAETLSFSGVTVGYSTIPETPETRKITKTSLSGLNAYVRPFHIQSTAYDSSHSTAVTLEHHFDVAFVPIFQFAVFYENDLEIAPGPPMTINGRIHTNSDLYIQADNSITVNSYTTAHGNIYHGRKSGSGLGTSNGDVQIMAADGSYYSMQDGADWLDAHDAYWFDSSSNRWGGRVQDAAYGQEALNLPLENTTDSAYKIVQRETLGGGNDDSMEKDATFKIIDGIAYYKSGSSWVDVTAPLAASGALIETTFYDKREESNVTVYDIDMDKFKGSSYVPSNGIVYISDQRSGLHGTRIYNADDIGAPLTIASENPVYTKGDINTTSKQPMAIICDALTILSDNWSDDPALAAANDKSLRQAINTAANFCYITGNKETGEGGSAYNGGLENLPRFLEVWSGDTFTYRGSIVCLWHSQKTSGDWGGSYYTPPNRDWAFDQDLKDAANMPPGTPMVRSFIRWGWKMQDITYTPSQFSDLVSETN